MSARDRLVLSYTPMVRYLAAKKIRELPAHCDLDDLASAGLVALIEAVDRFEPAKGATFEGRCTMTSDKERGDDEVGDASEPAAQSEPAGEE